MTAAAARTRSAARKSVGRTTSRPSSRLENASTSSITDARCCVTDACARARRAAVGQRTDDLIGEQLLVAGERGERRAQLVRHRGEEAALRAIGRLRLLEQLGLPQRERGVVGDGAQPMRLARENGGAPDVARHGEHAEDHVVRDERREQHRPEREARARRCMSGRAEPLKSSTDTTSRVRSTSRASEPGSANRRPRAIASGPIAATSSPSLATRLSTAAPVAAALRRAPRRRESRAAPPVSVSPAIWRARRRAARRRRAPSRASRRSVGRRRRAQTVASTWRSVESFENDVTLDAVVAGGVERVEQRLGAEDTTRGSSPRRRSVNDGGVVGVVPSHGRTSGGLIAPRRAERGQHRARSVGFERGQIEEARDASRRRADALRRGGA